MTEENQDIEEIADNVSDLLDQLQESNADTKLAIKKAQELEDQDIELNDEELDKFVINNSAKLINKTNKILSEVQQYVLAAPNAEAVDSLSSLIKANTSAIDLLNKLNMQKQKTNAAKDIKVMDSQTKHEIEDKKTERTLVATREEVFQMLRAESVDVETEDVPETL